MAGVIRDGENGWQYTGGADFQEKLERFLSDAALRQRMSAAARASAETFSAEQFAAQVEVVYEMQIRRFRRMGNFS